MEHRSPLAARYEPPVQREVWVTERAMAPRELLAMAQHRCGLDTTRWQRMLWHGGLHVARRRIVDVAALGVTAAGARVAMYWFEREPDPVALPTDAVCLDEHGVVAVNKPAWLPVQGTRVSTRFCLEHALRVALGCRELQAVHRLDRVTSGVNLFARSSEVAARLCRQFARRQVSKRYLAWVWPSPAAAQWCVEGYLRRVAHPRHAYFALATGEEAAQGGRYSKTRFAILGRRGERTLVEATPETGRTHQIRIHLAAGGTPILGDGLYGRGYDVGAPWSALRLQLHAAALRFELGAQAATREVTIEAPTPADWLA